MRRRDVRLWHKADISACLLFVRFRGPSGHGTPDGPDHPPLLTHSGHKVGRNPIAAAFRLSSGVPVSNGWQHPDRAQGRMGPSAYRLEVRQPAACDAHLPVA
jgi:hypothetical protein